VCGLLFINEYGQLRSEILLKMKNIGGIAAKNYMGMKRIGFKLGLY